MDHCGTQRLETDRLILRRFVKEDSVAIYKNWASDSEVTKYLTWQVHPNEKVSKQAVKTWLKQYSDENYYHWAIVLKENGDEPIGGIDVVLINEDVSMVHIGYYIGRNAAYDIVKEGKIKTIRIGKRYIIPKTSVINFLETAS